MRNLIITLLVVLILVILGLGGLAGYYFASGWPRTSFTDTVMFVMALVGLLIALASFGIWAALRRILHEDIQREISRREDETRNEALARIASKVSDAFWAFYEGKQDEVFREQAMKMVSDARNVLEGEQKIDKEELKCRIYNNLAFAYANTGETKYTASAHFLSSYVKERAKNFPNLEASWLETYAYVLYRLPKKHDDKNKAIEIIQELLERPDIEDERKQEIRKRYGLSSPKVDQASSPEKE